MTDDFEARWRAVADADPMHATYPEAVPGYRRTSGTRGRGFNLDRVSIDEAEAFELPEDPDDGDAIMPHAGSAMKVIWHKPDPDVPPVSGPVVIIERLFDSEAELRQALATEAPKLATPDAVQALRDAIARYAARPAYRWWDPRGWWRR